jgi:hypothetical protein
MTPHEVLKEVLETLPAFRPLPASAFPSCEAWLAEARARLANARVAWHAAVQADGLGWREREAVFQVACQPLGGLAWVLMWEGYPPAPQRTRVLLRATFQACRRAFLSLGLGVLPDAKARQDLDALLDAAAVELNWVEELDRRRRQPKAAAPRKPKMSFEEAKLLVAKYLRKHKVRVAQGKVGAREVCKKTGVSIGMLPLISAWKKYQDDLEKKGLGKRPRRKAAVAYTNTMDKVAGGSDPQHEARLRDLIRESVADSVSDPSPLDKGKSRGHKVKARKQV